MSQYARANNLANGLGCVKGKPKDDFKEMIFSLDFLPGGRRVWYFFIKLKIQKTKFVCKKSTLNPNYALA